MKLQQVNKKPLARKRIFVQTPVSYSTSKKRANKILPAKPLAFSLHFLFRRAQNHHSNLTSNIIKLCEQILKNITGRIPELARSENPIRRHPTTYPTKHAYLG